MKAMMPTQIKHSNPHGPVTDGQLQIVEEFLGVNLPRDYRTFLLEHNGGEPEPNVVRWGEASDSSDIVREFYGVHRGPSHANLIWTTKVFAGRIPERMIPIADDPFGNQYCLALTRGRGKVFFWDHELEGSEDEDEPLILIAESFTEFFESFEVDENPQGEP
ncbi:MAG: SMI1/KNR4 family protein [Myxococcota bacterium]